MPQVIEKPSMKKSVIWFHDTYWNSLVMRSWRKDSWRCSFISNVMCLKRSRIFPHLRWFVIGTSTRRSVKVKCILSLSLKNTATDISVEQSFVSKLSAVVTRLFWPSSPVLFDSPGARFERLRFSTLTVRTHCRSIRSVGQEQNSLTFVIFAKAYNNINLFYLHHFNTF